MQSCQEVTNAMKSPKRRHMRATDGQCATVVEKRGLGARGHLRRRLPEPFDLERRHLDITQTQDTFFTPSVNKAVALGND